MTTKARLRQLCLNSRLRLIAQPTYGSVIATELAVQRAVDRLRPTTLHAEDEREIGRNLTAIIKTFERPRLLERLVRSIRRAYPQLRIIVADDSRTPTKLEGVTSLALPYDIGVSEGRNRALERVETDYVLVLDDDFIFYRHTDLGSALRIMRDHPEIDIMGGKVFYLPFFSSIDYGSQRVLPTPAEPKRHHGSRIAGLPVYEKVANFFIGRTNRVRRIGWDPALKRLDHEDFFTRAKGELTCVFNDALRCMHAWTPFDSAYMSKRFDVAADLVLLKMKHFRSTDH